MVRRTGWLLCCLAAGCGGDALRDAHVRAAEAPKGAAPPIAPLPGSMPAVALDRMPGMGDGPALQSIDARRCATACLPGCTRGDAATRPIWSYAWQDPGDRGGLDWRGLADAEGNVYWREIDAALNCTLVSAAPDGTVRYRAQTPCNLWQGGADAEAFIRGGLFVSAQHGRFVAHDVRDGAMAWTQEQIGPPAGCSVDHPVAIAASDDALFAVLGVTCGERRGFQLLVLDLATGAVRARGAPEIDDWIVADPLVVADADGAYVRWGLDPRGDTHVDHLFAVDAQGRERWRLTEVVHIDPESEDEDDLFEPVALAGGRLFVRGDGAVQVRDAASGAVLHELPDLPTEFSGPPLGSWSVTGGGSRAYLVDDGLALHALDDGAPAWSRAVCRDLGICTTPELLLTDAGTVLLRATSADYATETSTTVLTEIGADGSVRRSCALAGGAGRSVIRDGMLITRGRDGIVAYRVPGISEGTSGWTSGGGGPQRGGRPQ